MEVNGLKMIKCCSRMRQPILLHLTLILSLSLWVSPVLSQGDLDSEPLSKELSEKIMSNGEIIDSSISSNPLNRQGDGISWYHVRYKGTFYICYSMLGSNSNNELAWSMLRCLEPI